MPVTVSVLAAFNPFTWVADHLLQEAVVGMLWLCIWMIINAPEPHLTAAWFRGEYGIILQISLWLLIPIVFAATIAALMRGGLQAVLRTYLWAVPIGIFGGVVAIALIEIAIEIDHELTAAVFARSRETVQSFYEAMNKQTGGTTGEDFTQGAASYSWGFVQMLMMIPMLALTVMLVIEMFFRQVMIYMAAMFIPFSLAAFIWGPIRYWFYSLCELILTMVFAKFVIAAIVSFGFTALAYGITGNGEFTVANIGVVLGALIVLTLACLSGPALVAFIMSPGHQILSFRAARQLTPGNHDRAWSGTLAANNYRDIRARLTAAGRGVAT